MIRETWVSSADRALMLAMRQIKLIRAVTPADADGELARLEQAVRREKPRTPRWRYDPPSIRPELRRALDELASLLETRSPLGAIYAARARELCLEAAIIDAVGTPKLRKLAQERFLGRSAAERVDDATADEWARAWTATAVDTARDGDGDAHAIEHVRSCDTSDPRSLVSRMASEAGRHKLPMRILVEPGLASLAATGDGAILVAAGKWIASRDVERTVLHEIEGHALPRARAAQSPLGIFAIGTARGIDDQEGRALAIEEGAGFLDAARRRELGLRHLAARATFEGQSFADVVAALRERGATIETAVRIAARVQRGGSGADGSGGLAREFVYLPALVRVSRLRKTRQSGPIEQMMRGGRIAADVALTLASALSEETNDEISVGREATGR